MQRRAIEELTGLLRDKLAAAEIPAADMRGYVTPRRLTVIAEGIPAAQPDRTEERRGPRVGAPPAGDRGLFALGRDRLDRGMRDPRHRQGRILFRDDQPAGPAGGRGVAGAGQGGDLRAAVAEIDALSGFVAALGPAADLGGLPVRRRGSAAGRSTGLPVGRITRGHRFLVAGRDLRRRRRPNIWTGLAMAHVVLDQDRRKETIRKDLEARGRGEGYRTQTGCRVARRGHRSRRISGGARRARSTPNS